MSVPLEKMANLDSGIIPLCSSQTQLSAASTPNSPGTSQPGAGNHRTKIVFGNDKKDKHKLLFLYKIFLLYIKYTSCYSLFLLYHYCTQSLNYLINSVKCTTAFTSHLQIICTTGINVGTVDTSHCYLYKTLRVHSCYKIWTARESFSTLTRYY